MFERRYRIEVGNPRGLDITVVGCGGTGSFLALHLARMAYHARDRRGYPVRLRWIDPDVVEDANIGRQNFCQAEVGRNKAWCVMERYNRAFGLDSTAYARPLELDLLPRYDDETLYVVCGCVDNAPARRLLHDCLEPYEGRLWWLDGGNHDHSGQVLLGNRIGLHAPLISPLGVCAGLPSPGNQHPELIASSLKAAGEPPTPEPGDVSCADLALADVQGLMVNQAVAGWMATYVYRLAMSRDLDAYATYFDLAAGSARSEFVIERREAE